MDYMSIAVHKTGIAHHFRQLPMQLVQHYAVGGQLNCFCHIFPGTICYQLRQAAPIWISS